MKKLFTFASTESDFNRAAIARYDHGPCFTMFSTESITFHSLQENYADLVFLKFREHPVFKQLSLGKRITFHVYDETGTEVNQFPVDV